MEFDSVKFENALSDISWLMSRDAFHGGKIDKLDSDVSHLRSDMWSLRGTPIHPAYASKVEYNEVRVVIDNLASELVQLKKEIGHLNAVVGKQREVIRKYESIIHVHNVCDSIADDIGGKDRKWSMA